MGWTFLSHLCILNLPKITKPSPCASFLITLRRASRRRSCTSLPTPSFSSFHRDPNHTLKSPFVTTVMKNDPWMFRVLFHDALLRRNSCALFIILVMVSCYGSLWDVYLGSLGVVVDVLVLFRGVAVECDGLLRCHRREGGNPSFGHVLSFKIGPYVDSN